MHQLLFLIFASVAMAIGFSSPRDAIRLSDMQMLTLLPSMPTSNPRTGAYPIPSPSYAAFRTRPYAHCIRSMSSAAPTKVPYTRATTSSGPAPRPRSPRPSSSARPTSSARVIHRPMTLTYSREAAAWSISWR